jgi:acyl-CoA reductase-like NAD-dependent aldehyde dehydrogenase
VRPAIVAVERIAPRLRVGHPVSDDVAIGAILDRERDERALGCVRLAVAPAQRW